MSHVETVPSTIPKNPSRLFRAVVPGDTLGILMKGGYATSREPLIWELMVLEKSKDYLTLKANMPRNYPFEYVLMAFLKKGRFVTADNQPIPFLQPEFIRSISRTGLSLNPHDFIYKGWIAAKTELLRQLSDKRMEPQVFLSGNNRPISIGPRGLYSLIHYLLAAKETVWTKELLSTIYLMKEVSPAELRLLNESTSGKKWQKIERILTEQSRYGNYSFKAFDGTGVSRYLLYYFINRLLIGGMITSTPQLHALLISYFPSAEIL